MSTETQQCQTSVKQEAKRHCGKLKVLVRRSQKRGQEMGERTRTGSLGKGAEGRVEDREEESRSTKREKRTVEI